jgi:DNA-binding NarL/FixJ family response regulator
MLNVLVVDDHPSFRRGVKEILTEELNPVRISEAVDAQEMLDLVQRTKWDLVIMDISMPGQTGPGGAEFRQRILSVPTRVRPEHAS